MELATILLFLVAGISSLFMAWVIGAGSSGATPFAPAVGANAISTMRAAFLVGILGFAGAVTQGASVSEAVGAGLVDGVTLPTVGVIVVLVIGAGLMAFGISTGYPIATAFTVTGAVVGVGFAIGGDPAWEVRRNRSRVGTDPVRRRRYRIRHRERPSTIGRPETVSVPILAGLVGAVVVNLEFVVLESVGGSIAAGGTGLLPVAGVAGVVAVSLVVGTLAAALVRWDVRRDLAGGLRRFCSRLARSSRSPLGRARSAWPLVRCSR